VSPRYVLRESTVSLRCLSESELLQVLQSGAGRPDGSAEAHLAICPECQARFRDLMRTGLALGSTASAGTPGPACLDEAALTVLVTSQPGEARAQQLAHLAECDYCRRELGDVLSLLEDPDVAAALAVPQQAGSHFGRRRLAWAAAGLAAGLALFALALPRLGPANPWHRAPTITAAPAPQPGFPLGDVPEARALRWGPVAGADRYRIVLFDATGQTRYRVETTDTTAELPDSVQLIRGQSYLWRVEARTEPERWTASELVEFRVVRRSP